MIRKKEYKNLNIGNLPGNIDAIKSFFEKKDATCSMDTTESDIYKFTYSDNFHKKSILVKVHFNLQKMEKTSLKIVIEMDDSINTYDIEDYSNQLFADIYMKLLEGPTKYIVRVYGRYYSKKPQDLEINFEWGDKIDVKPFRVQGRDLIYNADSITNSPHEQMLTFDVEVFAIDVTSARTLAYNRAKEVFSFLSVLFDLGIDEFQSEQVLALADYKEADNDRFGGTAINKGFYDEELDLLVFDNLNGLIALDGDKMVLNGYYTVTVTDSEGNKSTLSISKDNPKLDEIFKQRELKKVKRKVVRGDLNKEISNYNTDIRLLSSHITFFRKLKIFETKSKEKFERFSNACKLYNKALSVCANEPTMMVSYLVASIEALLKIEIKFDYLKGLNSDMNRFLAFVEKYSTEGKFEKEYLKYLYGTIRSGHLHSGDFKFLEYNVLFNQTLNSEFINVRNDYIKAKSMIRAIFITWIEENILEK